MNKHAIMGQCPRCGGDSYIQDTSGKYETFQTRVRVCYECQCIFDEEYQECLRNQTFCENGETFTIYPEEF
jgi:hypothetical protein